MSEGFEVVFMIFEMKIDAVVKFTRFTELGRLYNVGLDSLGLLYSK